MDKHINHQILAIALPSIITNITVPLLGLIDTTIVGHMGAAAYIGAIALGSMLFNLIYWNFGFLRMGTSGLTAQAYGRNEPAAQMRILVQALGVGMAAALLLLAIQYPVEWVAFALIQPDEDIRQLAATYFHIVICGAPAVMMIYGFKGWFLGMQNSRFPMYIAITMNVVNIICSLLLVYVLKMKVEGVALGTVAAQYAGLFLAIGLWLWRYSHMRRLVSIKACLHMEQLKQFFAVNRDIFLRTLCLIAVTTFFTSYGAKQGATLLAVNTLLMQLFTLFSYIMDGFAYAGEALTGRYVGARDADRLHRSVRQIFIWGGALTAIFTLAYALFGTEFLALLTNEPSVIEAAHHYFLWILCVPVVGFAAFLWDGILIGATSTRLMLWAMALAAAAFFGILYAPGELSNHRLWVAFLTYLLVRSAVQTVGWKRSVLPSLKQQA